MYAMAVVALGVAASPIDWGVSWLERRRYERAPQRTGPVLFICGAPRSGTTVAHQTLVAALPVAAFTNVVNIFPHSPLIATRILRRWIETRPDSLHSFYGRTAGLGGLNDALPVWDRYLGADRNAAPQVKNKQAARELRQFLAAWTQAAGRPLVAKCNRLNAGAVDMAAAVPEAYFACLVRQPLWQAQSLYAARQMIHGDETHPYGLAPPASRNADDPVESVCQQVLFHHQLAHQQQAAIGAERFWIVRYEEFCRDPGAFVDRAAHALRAPAEADRLANLPPLSPHNVPRIETELLDRMRQRLEELGLGEAESRPRTDTPHATPATPASKHNDSLAAARKP